MTEITQNLETFSVEFLKAQNDCGPFGFLGKTSIDYREDLGLNDNERKAVETVSGRAKYHLHRLLEKGRSTEERQFALAYALHAQPMLNDLRGNDLNKFKIINGTINSEGNDTCLWWTLSPYLFDLLHQRLGDKQAIAILLGWAENGHSIQGINLEKDDLETVHLRGLEIYNSQKPKPTFVLSPNPQGYSHAFAHNEADRLVKSGIFG